MAKNKILKCVLLIVCVIIFSIGFLYVFNLVFCQTNGDKDYTNKNPKLCINNLITTFYLNEDINLDNTTMSIYEEDDSGNMVEKTVSITSDMISNFDTSTIGTKTLKITYNDSVFDVYYYVIEKSSEKITSESFTLGNYYEINTDENTEHFNIAIESGCYIGHNYKTMIETIYSVQEKISGLEFEDKLYINVKRDVHPNCSGLTVNIDASSFFTVVSNAFSHELGHALNHSQDVSSLPTRTLTEGFATYIEYLTANEIRINYPHLYPYIYSVENTLYNYSFLNSKMYMYDFETIVLNLKQDEIAANSIYETGARFFAYLNHRYGDFCGWMKDERFNTDNVKIWIELMKEYYNNEKLFEEFYPYEQSMVNKSYVLCGANDVICHQVYDNGLSNVNNFSLINKLNYYLNFGFKLEYQGQQKFTYKDLYLNIESIRHQLGKSHVYYDKLKMQTNKDVVMELYNNKGELIRVVENTSDGFLLDNISFIKLVGSGSVAIDVTYTK